MRVGLLIQAAVQSRMREQQTSSHQLLGLGSKGNSHSLIMQKYWNNNKTTSLHWHCSGGGRSLRGCVCRNIKIFASRHFIAKKMNKMKMCKTGGNPVFKQQKIIFKHKRKLKFEAERHIYSQFDFCTKKWVEFQNSCQFR